MSSVTRRDAAQELLARRAARETMAAFIHFTKPDYVSKPFNRSLCHQLDLFVAGRIRKLIVTMPPQHGKSEATTRRLPAYMLGRNPDLRFAITTYAADIATSFNRDIQRIIDGDEYLALFPGTRLNSRNVVSIATGATLRNADKFEIVGQRGFVKTVGVGGPLTSTSVDIGIVDDPLKDREAAKSSTIREKIWNWYTDVFESRLHNESQQLLIMTRWDEDDLVGRALKRDGIYSAANPTGWVLVKFEAIKTGSPTDYDPRAAGEVLFPERHSLERMRAIEQNNPITFNSLYQQDPRPSLEALVYPMWQQVPQVPEPLRYVVPTYGLDFGFTNDPTALVRVRQHNQQVALEEVVYATGLSNADIKLAFLTAGGRPQDVIYADSAEPKSIADLKGVTLCEATAERRAKHPTLAMYIIGIGPAAMYRLPGLNVRPAVKGPDSVDAGLNMLRNDVRVVVTLASSNLWRERNRYEFIMHDGKSTNVPRDRDNHALDAARYALFSARTKQYRGLL